MRKCASVLLLGLMTCLLAGCFDVEQSLVLEKDMSGKAGFAMTVNFEPMTLFMLQFQRSMEGKEGQPTAAEIDKAKKDFLASRKDESDPKKLAADKAEMVKNLPPGVKLLESDVKDQGMSVAVRFLFGFDDFAKLGLIQLPNEKGKEKQPGPGNPFEDPFGNVKLVDEGKTLLLTSIPVNPLAEQQEQTAQMDLTPEQKKQMEDAFKGLRLAFKVTTPFEVVETNATRRDGKTLYWEYDLPAFEKMAKEKAKPEGMRARFRK